MANIRISALEIELSGEVLKEYNKYLEQSVLQSANPEQLEKIFAGLYGANRISGNPPLVPDFEVPAEGIIKGLAPNFFKRDSDKALRIEAKFTTRDSDSDTNTTIGGRVTGSVLSEIRSSRGFKNFAEEKEDDIYYYMNKRFVYEGVTGIAGGAKLFDFLKKQAPMFHKEAYNKAKNLTIFSQKSKNSTSVIAYQIFFPLSSFNSQNFGVGYEADNSKRSYTFSYFLRNAFENKLKASVQANITKASLDNFSTLEYDKYKSATRKVKVRGSKEQSVSIYWAHSNSIPVANIKARIPKQQSAITAQPRIIDITMLVRGRTRLKMRRGTGTPNPPKIYERSGTFRGSIQAVANMQSNTINYFYIPYYSSLQKYGYEIDGLVEGSIRAIAQERFGSQFILRKNTQPIN